MAPRRRPARVPPQPPRLRLLRRLPARLHRLLRFHLRRHAELVPRRQALHAAQGLHHGLPHGPGHRLARPRTGATPSSSTCPTTRRTTARAPTTRKTGKAGNVLQAPDAYHPPLRPHPRREAPRLRRHGSLHGRQHRPPARLRCASWGWQRTPWWSSSATTAATPISAAGTRRCGGARRSCSKAASGCPP